MPVARTDIPGKVTGAFTYVQDVKVDSQAGERRRHYCGRRLMSQAVGKLVRVQWMRWDRHGWEPKRPPIVQDMAGGPDVDGNVVA